MVDLDLEKFFDRVHHERLVARLEQRVKDPRLITLVRRMLNLAARKWRDDSGKTWLEMPPLLTLLPLIGHQREPLPITWAEHWQ